MNKDSSKDFKELDPDKVVYINEDQRPKASKPVVEDSSDVAAPKPKAPIFDLPLAQESKVPASLPEPKTPPSKPATLDISATETLQSDHRPPVSRVIPEPKEQAATPVAPVAQDRKEAPIQPASMPTLKELPKPLKQLIKPSLPSSSPVQSAPDRQLQDVQPRPALKPMPTASIRPATTLHRPPQPILDIAAPVVQHTQAPAAPSPLPPPASMPTAPPVAPPPPPTPPTMQTPSLILPAPLNLPVPSVSPPPPPLAEPQAVVHPSPPAVPLPVLQPPPPPLVLPKSPLATTDLQGNWGSPSTLSQTPPVGTFPADVKPIDAAPESNETEGSEIDQDLFQTAKHRGIKHLKIFGAVTLIFILSTVVLGSFFLWPYLQAVLESKRSEDAQVFENVLVNLLQVENQQMEIKITDKQLDKIQPVLENQEDIQGGKIVVNNILKVDYTSDFSRPTIGSKFRFDLDIQTAEKRDNFILDIVTVFNDQGAYFFIEDVSIDGQGSDLDQTTFGRRWSNLEDLLQVQASSEATALSENQSIILNYVANLLKLYSYPQYLFLLPIFNITQSYQYNAAREILLNSQAYYLQTNTCKDLQDTQRRCRLTIDYEQLYQLYVDIYEVLEVDLPSYYDILRTSDRKSFNLPETVELTFDTERLYPVLIEAPIFEGEISASSFAVNYEDFDISNLDIVNVSNPLNLVEYHRQILEYEDQELN